MTTAILTPVIVLVCWSMVMWAWLYITRIPAIMKANMVMDAHLPYGQQMGSLPAKVRWKAENYNHLMEQPTVFYAVAISLAMLGGGEGLNLYLAWGYVGLRIVHSLFQAMVNHIPTRWIIFMTASILLVILAVRALLLAIG